MIFLQLRPLNPLDEKRTIFGFRIGARGGTPPTLLSSRALSLPMCIHASTRTFPMASSILRPRLILGFLATLDPNRWSAWADPSL